MYELIILALLAQFPLHGYLIAKITNDMLGPYARLSSGRLYPLMVRLAEEGLIVVEGEGQPSGGRRQRTYRITERGRERCHRLMMDTTANLGDYQRIFWVKMANMSLLTLSERLYLVDHYITYCQTNIYHYVAEIADLPRHAEHLAKASPTYREDVLLVMEQVLRQWRQQLADVTALRQRLLAGGATAADVAGVAWNGAE
ncbi:MAG TPA: PadR family transcriptional regulator [Ktedonobacterales bacterium]